MGPFLPARDFKVIIDSELLDQFWTNSYLAAVINTIKDLKILDNPVTIKLFTPSKDRVSASFEGIVEAYNIKQSRFVPSKWLKEDRPVDFEKLENLDKNASELFSSCAELKADCIVTSNQALIDLRYLIYHYDTIRIIPLEEFHDFVEVCARGFSIYWSAISYTRVLTPDVYYQFDQPNGKKISDYFNSQSIKIKDDHLRENLRSLSLNRYAFILFTRDMIKFYELQNDLFTRAGQRGRFGTIIGYYVTNYYLYGWGLLEQLTTIMNMSLKLGLNEKSCGIAKDSFWDRIEDQELLSFKKDNQDWIQRIGDIRHLAAHFTIKIPTAILMHTDESKKSDDELRKELRKNRPYCYSMSYAEVFEKTEIDLLRIDKMRKFIPRAVFINKGKGKSYFYDPVAGVDYDLNMMNKFINKFLEKAFKISPGLKTQEQDIAT
ncbi:MAG: hypothetical protein WC369_00120 [Dehalococcoidales bacterium]|jgi:predicted nucleic acid-binding protein